MLEDIETWIYEQLSTDAALLEQFDADFAEKRLIRSGAGEEKDPYPVVMFTYAGETERETDRCGGLVRAILTWEVKVIVESRSFADSEPYVRLISAAMATKSGSSDDFIWKTTQGGVTGSRERPIGGKWRVHHGNIYQFEVQPAE
jgi:hypothetical protein